MSNWKFMGIVDIVHNYLSTVWTTALKKQLFATILTKNGKAVSSSHINFARWEWGQKNKC